MYRRLVDNLGKVDCEEVVVLSNDGVDFVQNVFALKEDSATDAGVNIYDTVDDATIFEQTETSRFIHGRIRVHYV